MSRTPTDLILNSRHWDLSQKLFMAPSLFACHQFSDRKYFSFWEGLAAQLPSFPNICWNDLPFQKPKERRNIIKISHESILTLILASPVSRTLSYKGRAFLACDKKTSYLINIFSSLRVPWQRL